jgi:myosin heavy subunit
MLLCGVIDTFLLFSFQDKIYTLTGEILISFNPYKGIPGLYDEPLKYLNREGNIKVANESPHIFKVANHALNALASAVNSNPMIVIRLVIA